MLQHTPMDFDFLMLMRQGCPGKLCITLRDAFKAGAATVQNGGPRVKRHKLWKITV